jgi:hypothetical protein
MLLPPPFFELRHVSEPLKFFLATIGRPIEVFSSGAESLKADRQHLYA